MTGSGARPPLAGWGDMVRSPEGIVLRVREGADPVVLIHCVALDSRLWRPLVDRIPRDRGVVAIDVPGHGESRPLRLGETLASVSRDIADALRWAGIRRTTVAGISMGGMIAQYLALDAGDLVARAVFGDTSFRRDDVGRRRLLDRAARLRESGASAEVAATIERWFSADFRATARGIVETTERALAEFDAEMHARAWELLASLDVEARIPSLSVPVSVVVGELDVSTTPDDARELVARIPGAVLHIIPGAGHLSVLEAPGAWLAVVIPDDAILKEKA